jgi:hypothetical protein
MEVQDQPMQKVNKTPSQLIKLGMVAYICYPSYVGRIDRRIKVQIGLGNNTRPYPKTAKAKKASSVAKVV